MKNDVNILFLGTGAGDFQTFDDPDDDNRYLARARELGGRSLRYASSALLLPHLLIDFHDDRQLRRFGVETDSIRQLFVTHAHWDHFQPRAILELAAGLPHELAVYGNEAVRNSLEFAAENCWDGEAGRFRRRNGDDRLRFHLVRPEETVRAGDVAVTAVQSNHKIDKAHMIAEEQTLNYVFEQSGKTIFYGLDSSFILPRTLEILSQFRFDLAVLDATFGDLDIDREGSGHQDFTMVEETIAELREAEIVTDQTRVLGSHISVRHVAPHDDIATEVSSRRGFELAYDGMTVGV